MSQPQSMFEKAVQDKAYEAFFLGKGPYYVKDREVDEHWPYGSYIKYVQPLADKLGELTFERFFWQAIENMLEAPQDVNLCLDAAINYLMPFYNVSDASAKQQRVESTPASFVNRFKSLMNANKERLIADKRSVGVDWNMAANKGQGLWGGILYNLEIIKKRGGPDLSSSLA